jgi:hypothetical protein
MPELSLTEGPGDDGELAEPAPGQAHVEMPSTPPEDLLAELGAASNNDLQLARGEAAGNEEGISAGGHGKVCYWLCSLAAIAIVGGFAGVIILVVCRTGN